MKSIFLIIVGIFLGFIILSNSTNLNSRTLKEFLEIEKKQKRVSDRYKSYDPGNDHKFSKKYRDYFNQISKFSEFEGQMEISRWHTNMKIYVEGDQRVYLMEELDRIVNELNEIINPIEIEVVENQNDANFIIYLTNENQYTQVEPEEKQKIINNWGLFVVHGGKRIHKGTMYVDLERCTSIDGQKHLLREELTQSLGLMNDSYDYPESIFYQKWSETTEYAPIDRTLIDMLYNHW